jgi:sn-glycerol 3-phosphate transport system substrate-binding protein
MLQSTGEQQLAAWLFIAWLVEPEQQAEWARGTGDLPVRPSAAREIEEYASAGLDYEAVHDWLQTEKSEPAPAQHDIIRLLIDEAMLQVIEGAGVEDTLEDLEEEVNALVGAE